MKTPRSSGRKATRSKTSVKKSSATRSRARRLAVLFNITQEEYDKILKFQGGGCAITGVKFGRLCVDHDHKDGALRGILSWKINRALESFKDNPQWLRAAADYLENPPIPQALGEVVHGVLGRVTRKPSNRRYGPDGSKTPQPRSVNAEN